MKILNEFGIKPTYNFTAAGADFYIPYFDADKKNIAFSAFSNSYKIPLIDIENICSIIKFYQKNVSEKNLYNIVHLFLALDSTAINSYEDNILLKITLFLDRYLIFDKNGRPGIKMELNDSVLINSGIRVALNPGTAGIFLNKSGKGNAGFDVRAQVVDEDYTGFVHLSSSYTKDTERDICKIYCGDKLQQMLILPVIHTDYEEVTPEDYFKTMENSNRGSLSFGSSDESH